MQIESDDVEKANEAIENSKTSPTETFVAICFYHTELTPSLFTAMLFNKFRLNYSSDTVGRIFIIDSAKNPKFAARFGVIPTPAIVIIWKGHPLEIRRPSWDLTNKIVGSLSEECWLSILRYMANLPKDEERKFLSVNF